MPPHEGLKKAEIALIQKLPSKDQKSICTYNYTITYLILLYNAGIASQGFSRRDDLT